VTLEFEIQGEMLEQTGQRGSTSKINEHLKKSEKIIDDGKYTALISFKDLMAGKWQFTIHSGSWTDKFTCHVIGDRTHDMKLTFGQNGYKTYMIHGKK
jgi:hypothetical protein